MSIPDNSEKKGDIKMMKGMQNKARGAGMTDDQRLERLRKAARKAAAKKKVNEAFDRGLISLVPEDWESHVVDGEVGILAPEEYLSRLRSAHIAYEGE
ncbi:MAG: hypothetical protein AAB467_00750 [Patescibacteria group bacterium]